MAVSDSTLLRGWRHIAYVGYHSGLRSLSADETNRVLRYHSVGGGTYDDFDPERLRRDVEYLDARYEIVDLPDVLRPSETKRIALTFDDGYRDFYRHVVPILREYEAPATVFVIADAIDDPSFNHNERFEYEYMDRDELAELVDEELVTIGNHTQSHPRLPDLSPERMEDEIVGAKRRLESTFDVRVDRFCYPYNAFDGTAAGIVRETHDVGVAGRGRREPVSVETDPAAVPRVNGANPAWEVRWDLSDTATLVGSVCERFVDPGT